MNPEKLGKIDLDELKCQVELGADLTRSQSTDCLLFLTESISQLMI